MNQICIPFNLYHTLTIFLHKITILKVEDVYAAAILCDEYNCMHSENQECPPLLSALFQDGRVPSATTCSLYSKEEIKEIEYV
jgi:hypothetical protein